MWLSSRSGKPSPAVAARPSTSPWTSVVMWTSSQRTAPRAGDGDGVTGPGDRGAFVVVLDAKPSRFLMPFRMERNIDLGLSATGGVLECVVGVSLPPPLTAFPPSGCNGDPIPDRTPWGVATSRNAA